MGKVLSQCVSPNSQDPKVIENSATPGAEQNSNENSKNQKQRPFTRVSYKAHRSQFDVLHNSSEEARNQINFEDPEMNERYKSKCDGSTGKPNFKSNTEKCSEATSMSNSSVSHDQCGSNEALRDNIKHTKEELSYNEKMRNTAGYQSTNEVILPNSDIEPPKMDPNTTTQNPYQPNKKLKYCQDGDHNVQNCSIQITDLKVTENSNAETSANNHNVQTDQEQVKDYEKNVENDKQINGEEEDHGQSASETVEETKKEEPLQILDVHQYFRDDFDLNSLDCLSPIERIDKISTHAGTFESKVKEFKEEKYSLEYFILDEKLMQLIEKLDRIKCQNDVERKKKIEVIIYIKQLHTILDECAK